MSNVRQGVEAVTFVRILILGFLCLLSILVATDRGPLNPMGNVVAFSSFVFVPALYVLPTYEAWARQHSNIVPIALINLLLGWTLVGWVAAIVWAVKRPEEPKARTIAAVRPTADERSIADELQKLAALRDKGVLSDDEFAQQKSRLLARIR